MDNESFLTRQQVAEKLGMSIRTLRRRLKKADIIIKGQFISQQVFRKIKKMICKIE